MDKLSRRVKDLETKLHNFMLEVSEQKEAQLTFNASIANNIQILGMKVLPEQFDDKGRLKPVKKESKIITSG